MSTFEIKIEGFEFGDETYVDEVICGVEEQTKGGLNLEYADTLRNIVSHRWAETAWLVFRSGDSDVFYAAAFDFGSTEDQPDGFTYSQPVLFRVYPHEKTIIQWMQTP